MKYQKTEKIHHSLREPKLASSNVKSPKPKDIQFTVIYDEEKQKIKLPFEEPKLEKVQHFFATLLLLLGK